jgi:hypothetical protein
MTLRLGFVAMALLGCQRRDLSAGMPDSAIPAYNQAAKFANAIGPLALTVASCSADGTVVTCSGARLRHEVTFRCTPSGCVWVDR